MKKKTTEEKQLLSPKKHRILEALVKKFCKNLKDEHEKEIILADAKTFAFEELERNQELWEKRKGGCRPWPEIVLRIIKRINHHKEVMANFDFEFGLPG